MESPFPRGVHGRATSPRHPPRANALRWLATLALAAAAAAQAQQHAHDHGRLTLQVAVDAQSITVRMEAPLDNFLGFEHAPRTDAQRRQVAEMAARLRAADQLFVPDPAAGCRLQQVRLDSAVLAGDNATRKPDTAAGAEKKEPEHADMDAEIVFACTDAGAARFIDVRLFEVFKRVSSIDAQLVSGQGQFKRSLTRKAPRLAWGR